MRIKTLLKRTIVLMFATLALFSCDRDDTYIVSFDANGGMGHMQSQLFDAGVPQALTQNLYTRNGYTFSGWNTMQAGNGTAYTNGQTITVTSDMTLYAQWTSNGTSGGGQSGSGTGSGTQGEEPHTGGNGVLNGHYYVDLGLPSGNKWATCNVGATSPEGYGDYFAWGETTPKDYYHWSTYIYCNGSATTFTKYCNNADYGNNGFTDNLTTLESSDDAATVNWGSGWRMPTEGELNELYSNCTYEWTTQSDVNGGLVTGPNGNSIFLPAAGHCYRNEFYGVGSFGRYWTSSLSDSPYFGSTLFFNSDNYSVSVSNRDDGYSVRAVCNQ